MAPRLREARCFGHAQHLEPSLLWINSMRESPTPSIDAAVSSVLASLTTTSSAQIRLDKHRCDGAPQ